jgi:phosphate transport system substrate-binding protein
MNKTILAAALGASLTATLVTGAGAQVNLKGSDTMLQLSQVWAENYQKAKGKVVTVTGGGSSTGLAALVNGSTDIANSSRPIKGSEVEKAKQRGFIPFEVPVARDGLAIVVNPRNPVTKLSVEQLRNIYNGTYKNWSQLGGPNQAIIAIGRDSSSGTYGFFQDNVLGGKPYRADMQTTPSTNAIAQTVSQDLGAIGYVGVAYATAFGARVKVVPVSKGSGAAVEPTEDNVRNGKYPLWRYLYMYTRGRPSGEAKAFIDWARTAEGQKLAEQVGYYPVK